MAALCLVCMTPQLARWYQQGRDIMTPEAACWKGDSRVPQTQKWTGIQTMKSFFQKGDALIWYPGKWIYPASGNKACANPDASNFWQVALWVPPSFSSNIPRRSLYGTTELRKSVGALHRMSASSIFVPVRNRMYLWAHHCSSVCDYFGRYTPNQT